MLADRNRKLTMHGSQPFDNMQRQGNEGNDVVIRDEKIPIQTHKCGQRRLQGARSAGEGAELGPAGFRGVLRLSREPRARRFGTSACGLLAPASPP